MEKLLQKKVSLARLPTPVDFFGRLSEKYRINLFIKRDDLTESIASGNKLRKMEYVLFDALEKGADTLITCGGIQSNHCRSVAWVAANRGLHCVLLLRGQAPEIPQGNLLLDRILGAEVRYYTPEVFKNINTIADDVCEELLLKGRRPYYIPMVGELAAQGNSYDHIYCATGSGGTLAGILLGCRFFNFPGTPHGMAVCDDTSYFVSELERIRGEFKEKYGIDPDFSNAAQVIDDRYVGTGYALNTPAELRTMADIAQTEGLVLDPVYSLKAFIGMLDHARQGIIQPGETALFIHTGGHAGIFPKYEEFKDIGS